MKKLVNNIKAELIKLSATPFFLIHLLVPMGVAAIFIGYYSFAGWDLVNKISGYYTVLGIAYPLIISLIIAIMTEQEFNAANYQNMLAVESRKKVFFSQASIASLNGILSVMLASILFGFCNIHILHVNIVDFSFYLIAGLMLSAESIILYFFHFFLSLRCGRNISILVAISEGLISALFRTGLGDSFWQFMPCSWGTRWCHNYLLSLTEDFVMENSCKTAVIVCILLSVFVIICYGVWCEKWEGSHINE